MINLDNNFFRAVFRTGIQKTRCQKSYELNASPQNYDFDFRGTNEQFDFLEVSLI